MSSALVGVLLLLAACGSANPELIVDLRTDLLPGRQFSMIRLELDGVVVARVEVSASDSAVASGLRVAEFSVLSVGEHQLRTSLVDASDEEVASQVTSVVVRGVTGVTVVISRSCLEVSCPPPADPTRSACLGGVCVDPRCTAETPEYCPESICRDQSDCPTASASCAAYVCAAGVCLLEGHDDRCEAGAYCDLNLGCQGSLTDAAVPDHTYAWRVGTSCGACSQACGGGTCPLEVSCQRDDGAAADEIQCAEAKPTPTQSCNTRACYTRATATSLGSGSPNSGLLPRVRVLSGSMSHLRVQSYVEPSPGQFKWGLSCTTGSRRSCSLSCSTTSPFLTTFTPGPRDCFADDEEWVASCTLTIECP